MRLCASAGKHNKCMPKELEELWSQIVNWPPEVQQKVTDAIRAIQAEYIDGTADSAL
jgi:hypothetical protein